MSWNVSNKQLYCKAHNRLLFKHVPHFPFSCDIRDVFLENT